MTAILLASQPFSGAGLAWGTAAGAVGAVGLVAYCQALATGETASSPPGLQRGGAAAGGRPGQGARPAPWP
jgi:hypothetical protein